VPFRGGGRWPSNVFPETVFAKVKKGMDPITGGHVELGLKKTGENWAQ